MRPVYSPLPMLYLNDTWIKAEAIVPSACHPMPPRRYRRAVDATGQAQAIVSCPDLGCGKYFYVGWKHGVTGKEDLLQHYNVRLHGPHLEVRMVECPSCGWYGVLVLMLWSTFYTVKREG